MFWNRFYQCVVDRSDNSLVGVGCACFGSDHKGHAQCDNIPDYYLSLETERYIVRGLTDKGWKWFIV
jgi:hypothetical protein